jgi:hypothetical protein
MILLIIHEWKGGGCWGVGASKRREVRGKDRVIGANIIKIHFIYMHEHNIMKPIVK